MAKGDTKTNQYLDIAANGTRADLPTDTCCETRTQTLIRGVAERIMDVEDEVEEIKNNPDVVDIVPTYAALQNYDTSSLTDKDIIRVLQDETHDGDSTYYRYNAQSGTWTYVGESKQYEDFVGTDGTTVGEAGLVPAPATTDAGKYLKADGTWGTVQAGPTVVQTTGTSTTDVMSQNAVSSMVFADPGSALGYNQKIRIGESATVSGNRGVAIGAYSSGSGYRSVALGDSASATGRSSVALAYSVANSKGEFAIGVSGTEGYNSSAYRLISGVYDGQSAHDAATKGQLDSIAIQNAGAPTTATVGTVGQLLEDTTNGKLYICTDTTGGSYTWVEVGAGGGGSGVIELTSSDYNYHSSGSTDDGLAPWLLEPGMYYIKATPVSPIRLYNSSSSASSLAQNESLIINKTTVSGDPMTNVISYTNSGNIWSVDYNASGTHKKEGQIITSNNIVSSTGTSTTDVMSQNAVTSMVYADTSNRRRVRIGSSASVNADYSVGIGSNANVDAKSQYGISFGADSVLTAEGNATTYGQVAIGAISASSANHSVALGSYANATTKGQVDISTSKTVNTYGYNNSQYRLLTGLYDPQSDHDAATKGYVDGLISALEARIAALEGN